MSDAELDQEIAAVRPSRNFTRLSVQLLEIALERITGVIASSLEGHQEHVPEPEPNPNRFTGYIKYHKDDYVRRYEEMKPLRDLARLIRTFLPNMRVIRDGLQRRFRQMVEQRELRQLRRRIQDQLNVNPLDPGLEVGVDDDEVDVDGADVGAPQAEDIDPLD